MQKNSPNAHWKKGLALSLITVFFWSTLPISLKISLDNVDPWSLTWLRFLTAALFTLLLLLSTKKLSQFKKLQPKHWLMLTIAAVMLVANYLFFLFGMQQTSPANAQVLIQMAPLLMTLGGVLIFKESFHKVQITGAILIIFGLLLFFNDQIDKMIQEVYIKGFILMFIAAFTWAIYALIQKHLSKLLSSQAILLFIYIFASFTLLWNTQFNTFSGLTTTQWVAVTYACINTIFAYGAFAEALNHWQASRVGMVLATTPVATLIFINTFAAFFPHLVQPENIQWIGTIGVMLIVSGSIMASLKK